MTTPWDPAITGSLTGVGPSTSAHAKRAALRDALNATTTGPDRSPVPLLLPGATDALGARLIEQTGFSAAYATGAGLANAVYGIPDLGLLSQREVVEHAERLADAINIPLITDADTGYGGPLSAMRTVRLLERVGVAGLQLEDQEMPKRCGHFDSHTLIPAEHMQTKIAAAVEAREDENLIVIARTDARSAYGIDEAIRRGHAYLEAGADVLFIEAPRTVEELELVGQEFAGTPLIVNVVEGGKTPELPLQTYVDLGFGVVLYANFLMRSMHAAGRDALAHLKEFGETGSRADKMASWSERQGLFNLPEFTRAEALLDKGYDELRAQTGDQA